MGFYSTCVIICEIKGKKFEKKKSFRFFSYVYFLLICSFTLVYALIPFLTPAAGKYSTDHLIYIKK